MDLDAYCARIGYNGHRIPTLDTLEALQALHAATIPFEAIDVLLGRGIKLAPEAVDAKLITAKRGGYCFEQNNLFKRVLAAMNFDVTGLLGRVLWMSGPGVPDQPRCHMAIRVRVNGEDWLADVGFGGGFPSAPLRLSETEPQRAGQDLFRLTPTDHGHLLEIKETDGWVAVYEMSSEPHIDADYEPGNWYCSTYPTSIFSKLLMVARVTPEARYSLMDNRLTVRGSDGSMDRRMLSADELEAALKSTFLLPVEPEWRAFIDRIAAADSEP